MFDKVLAFLAKILKPLIGRIMVLLGFSIVSYGGLYAAGEAMKALIDAEILKIPATILPFLGLMQIDKCLSILVSAWTIKIVRQGFKAGEDVKNFIT